MRNYIKGLHVKYIVVTSVIGLLTILSIFLPYIKISEHEITYSGIQYMIKMAESKTFGIQVLFMGGAAVFLLVASIMLLAKRSVMTAKVLTAAFIVQSLSGIFSVLSITKTVNKAGIVPESFLISYLGFGFWILFLFGFIGLVYALKLVKTSPGYIVLVLMSVIWLFPIAWVILISFREEAGSYTSYFWPKKFTFNNYYKLLTDTSQFQYIRWFFNTLLVAVCSCAISTFIVLSTAFTLSRIRFEGRRLFMNVLLILGMFPGFMSMIAVYYILKGIGISQSLIALILVYSGGSAMGYYIAKGFFDTIPKSLDEAAFLDGATKWTVFTKITMPLSKPIVIYTILTSFMGPWADFIFARVIMGDDYKNYTVALGLYTMLYRDNIDTWYTRFAAGAVLVSIPIAILFISLQKYYVEGLSGSVKG